MTVSISGTTPGIAVDGTGAVVNVTVTTGAGGGGGGVSLGETSTTAYRGDRGKTAYDHSQIVSGNPHGTTAADVGADPAGTAAGLVDDLSGVSNQATARTNLGLGSAATAATGDFATAAQGVDARTPTAHKTSHATGGTDALTASDIGAAATSHTHTGTQVTVDASGFNGNLTTSDDTLQEVAQKLDDLAVGGSVESAGSPTAYTGWFCPPGRSQSADAQVATLGNGTIYYVPCYTPHAITMTAVRSRVTSAVASTNVRRLVCSCDTNLMPDAVLWQDTFDASSTGQKDTTGLSVAIPAGWFLIACRAEGGAPQIVCVAQVGPMLRSNMASGESTPFDGFYKASTGTGTVSGTPPQPDTVWAGLTASGAPFSMRWSV